MKQRIFVLYTGGTIGMSQSPEGLKPDTALAEKALQPFAERWDFDWHICTPLIDSSAVTLSNWQQWLNILADKIADYDGILILHGTDTLAYTANILTLFLQDLDKPVVLTGSQWPFGTENSDAPFNLATAVAAFDIPDFAGVALAFNGKLFPAVGSSKVSTEDADGFLNAHFGVLGEWSAQTGWQNPAVRPSEKSGRLKIFNLDTKAKVVCHTLIPGFSVQEISDGLLHSQAGAVVLQSYGHGNAPSNEALISAVRSFTACGGLVLNISQVQKGCAEAVYAQGSALRHAGVVNGGKANLETATALLTLAVSQAWNSKQLQTALSELDLV
ncbi:asparaginase [Neisseria weaveri]|uniref:asparaginase n=1 Tax=Neisseria weaveri TaxID=28091 RepID=UPI0002231D3A|nr:asparaginase [Neisseria weaveri]EGV38519.1 hypothetical protein l13_00520 [Neisseria weaveri ATCC 51223]